jgi:hypothetical protein
VTIIAICGQSPPSGVSFGADAARFALACARHCLALALHRAMSTAQSRTMLSMTVRSASRAAARLMSWIICGFSPGAFAAIV